MAIDHECNGNGRHDGNLLVMDGMAQRQWLARLQLNSKGRRNGDLMAMDDKKLRERNSDVGAAGGGSNNGQRGIKTKNVVIDKTKSLL